MDACKHHFGDWSDAGPCEQVRTCDHCGAQEHREQHAWSEAQSDAEYCWRHHCLRCGKVEGQRHTFVYAYIVSGCCAHIYVCEGCGYSP